MFAAAMFRISDFVLRISACQRVAPAITSVGFNVIANGWSGIGLS